MHQTIGVLDFGSQYTQVIARRIRECSVFSKIYHYSTTAAQLKADGVCGIILSGGPSSVLSKNAPIPDPEIYRAKIPVLGICYGLQLIAQQLGGRVTPSKKREYGHAELKIMKGDVLFRGMPETIRAWNSHGDQVMRMPRGFRSIGSTSNSPFAAIEHPTRKIYGIQFHPEVNHTEQGLHIIDNFLKRVCGCTGDWSMADFIDQSVASIRETVGDGHVILGLSGGVDSSVAAALIHRAIGRNLKCVFVDNGLLRKDERAYVVDLFQRNFRIDLRVEKAGPLFLGKLRGITNPETKRKIIGRTFVQVFNQSLKSVGPAEFLAQGTLYPDVIESVAIADNPAALIKSHHNVGGLPKRMKLRLLEPLRELFKDEVRAVGSALGLPKEVVWRQPFPGPGLGVRVVGEVTARRLRILRGADAILQEEMINSGYYYKVWQSFCVLVPVRTVGVMGDERTYEYVIAIRAVESVDAMTADWVRLPYDLLRTVSSRIINEVKGANRVCLDISSKPPSTIEWE
ncbi:MAG: glutamine-hydrolyzing GMP synthase [Opitutaceae bacterium]